MFLAVREIRRAKARFALLVTAVSLLTFLILVQQALQNGLITGFVGAIRTQSAPVLVYSVDGQRTLQGSVVEPALALAIARVPGVAATAPIAQRTFTASVNGGDASNAALFAYRDAALGGPGSLTAGRLPRRAGEAVGSAQDFALGDQVRILGPGSSPTITVVGLAADAQIQVTPTLFVGWSDLAAASRAVNPDAGAMLPGAIAARPVAGVSAATLAQRINAALPQADALTRSQAAEKTPGVAQVRQSFQLIFALFALVVPLVTGLFFLIVTFQKSRSLTLLHAIGAEPRRLLSSLLLQVFAIVGGGIALGTLLYAPLSQTTVGSLVLRFDPRSVLIWAALLLGLGVLSAMVAARRVLRIDPVEATTGGGGR
ncbi:MAG: FtsX-like permease family protein [Actinomycetes bacterium]